ncbi:hypothetical protein niasHS_016748 [Heterodera schachtii]|uniref:JAB1/MPN/MOV34 metalloenzyme domain-containing protein n=1 Tax=Heterodera schachtii TaxID=97005 RepID=A0ABD2HNJ6_HETSC
MEQKRVSWYHSHPGYGCWLSGIDVNMQSINQQFQGPQTVQTEFADFLRQKQFDGRGVWQIGTGRTGTSIKMCSLFLRNFHPFAASYTADLDIITEDIHILEFVLLNIWPMFIDSFFRINLNAITFRRMFQLAPTMFTNCPPLRFVDSDVGFVTTCGWPFIHLLTMHNSVSKWHCFLIVSMLWLTHILMANWNFFSGTFETCKWKLNKQLLIHWDINGNGTKKMQIVNSDGNPLPIPRNPLPNKVIGFNGIQIIYIDLNVVVFIQLFHRFSAAYAMDLDIVTGNVRILEFIWLDILPMCRKIRCPTNSLDSDTFRSFTSIRMSSHFFTVFRRFFNGFCFFSSSSFHVHSFISPYIFRRRIDFYVDEYFKTRKW